jgi:acetyl esterase
MTNSPVDQEMLAFQEELAKHSPPEFARWPLPEQRKGWEEVCIKFRARRPERLMVEDLDVDGTHVRVYRPPGESPKPGVLYLHGGGWTMGSCETHDDICAEIADQTDVVVVMPEYRLAPEHPYPAAIEDSLKSLEWMRSMGRALGIDPARIIAAGDSAGGQLAAGLALTLKRDRLPQLRGVVLIYPALGSDFETKSYVRFCEGPGLLRDEMIECMESHLGTRGGPNWSDPIALPNLAPSVAGLPPTFIAVAAHDPLRDDGLNFARKLAAGGIPVRFHEEPALIHSYVHARHASAAAMAGFKSITNAVRHLAHEGMLPSPA